MFYQNPESLPYFEILKQARYELARLLYSEDPDLFRIFPIGCCNYSARVVAAETGFEEVGGFFVPRRENHAWNYDQERRLYVCLTLRQYGDYPEIAVMHVTTRLLRKDKKLTDTQRQMKLDDVDRVIASLRRIRKAADA